MRWGDTVGYWSRWQGTTVAVRFGDRDVTWAELDGRASSLAAGLADLGVGHGDRVGGRDDCRERKRNGVRHRGNQPMDEQAHAEHREEHEPERERENHAAIAQQPFFGDAPAVQEQQRRQK